MAIFRKASPETALEALRVRADKLEARRAAAQVTLDEAKARRQQHLLEGDLDQDEKAIGKLEADVNAASSRLSGLIDAISALNVQISEHEHRIQVERDQAERKAASERMLVRVVDFEARLDPMLSAMRLFASACEPLMAGSFEIVQLKEYLLKMAGEIEVCAAFVAPDLRLQAAMVERGERQVPRQPVEIIELRPVEPVVVTATDPAEPTVAVFAVAPLRWRDKAGNKHFAERWSDCQLPVRLQARASQRGVISGMDDPRRRTHRGLLGSFTPLESAICDLDSENRVLASRYARQMMSERKGSQANAIVERDR
jgi:hypothetical protein